MAIRVSLTGRVSIETEDARVDEQHIPGRQGRLVFVYLLAEQGRPVPRDELAEALWGNDLPATWVKALTVLVSKLRVMLEEREVEGIAITSEYGCYKLTLPEAARVDLTIAAEALERAEAGLACGDPDAARAAATAAIELAAPRFLPGEDGLWVEEKRRQLQRLLLRAYECHADAGIRSGHAEESMRSAEQIVELEPFRESGYRRLMQAHTAAGNSAQALTVYERCRTLLAEELGAYPSAEIESLYLEILRAPAPVATAERERDVTRAAGSARAGWSRISRTRLLLVTLAGGVVVALTVSFSMRGGDSQPGGGAIVGSWAATDQDGSHETMAVTRGSDGSYEFTLEDDAAQACNGDPVSGGGEGTMIGNEFTGTVSLTCASGVELAYSYPLTYRPADDTILDPVGVVWSRAGTSP